jgi:hypothetical protein
MVECQDGQQIYAQALQDGGLLDWRGQIAGSYATTRLICAPRSQYFRGVRVKGDECCLAAESLRPGYQLSDKGLVPQVNTIEGPDSDHAIGASGRMGQIANDPHG